MFYEEIGIEIFITDLKSNKNTGLFVKNKKIDITNNNSSDIENKAKQIDELEYSFKNIDDFSLKKNIF